MYMKAILIAIPSLLLAACGPTQQEIEQADYGPKPEDSEEIAERFVRGHLVDPDGARFSHSTWSPVQGYSGTGFMGAGDAEFGWVHCGQVNARNRMGGYTGREWFYVTIRHDRVVDAYIDTHRTYATPAADVCDEVRGSLLE